MQFLSNFVEMWYKRSSVIHIGIEAEKHDLKCIKLSTCTRPGRRGYGFVRLCHSHLKQHGCGLLKYFMMYIAAFFWLFFYLSLLIQVLPLFNNLEVGTLDILGTIKSSQAGDTEDTLTLIRKFAPLLKKYAYKLSYEDAYNDLLLDFLELLQNIKISDLRVQTEGGIVSYISAAVRSFYIKRLNTVIKKRNSILFSELTDEGQYYIQSTPAIDSQFSEIEFISNLSVLTQFEAEIITLIFYYGYKVSEIAKSRNVSRQAINQAKKRAIKKLKERQYKL